ncbi:hypothetical protein M5689_016227 [Euphorbia peplus]|nr:hypothetical protein M5689_016227 [Euphorbia peplus]
MTASESSSPTSSVISSSSSPPHPVPITPVGNQKQQGCEKRYKFRGVHVEDYGYWSPTPISGGGNYAPIPHGELA